MNEEEESEIEQGDYISFGAYGDLYVCNPTYTHDTFWVTDREKDRFDENAQGWSIKKYLAEKMIETGDVFYNDEEEWESSNIWGN